MAAFTDGELVSICQFTTDELLGFREQLKIPGRRAIPPEHFHGTRIDSFNDGAYIARNYLAYRKGAGLYLRSSRLKDFKERGGTSNYIPRGAERKAIQLDALRNVCRLARRGKTSFPT